MQKGGLPFEESPGSEWDGLDALISAKPYDLNGVRDSEYFGSRMSFYMSPPKEGMNPISLSLNPINPSLSLSL